MHMSGSISEHPVVHISVLDIHGVILVLTICYQHQPEQHGQGHVGGDTDGLQPFLGWQHSETINSWSTQSFPLHMTSSYSQS